MSQKIPILVSKVWTKIKAIFSFKLIACTYNLYPMIAYIRFIVVLWTELLDYHGVLNKRPYLLDECMSDKHIATHSGLYHCVPPGGGHTRWPMKTCNVQKSPKRQWNRTENSKAINKNAWRQTQLNFVHFPIAIDKEYINLGEEKVSIDWYIYMHIPIYADNHYDQWMQYNWKMFMLCKDLHLYWLPSVLNLQHHYKYFSNPSFDTIVAWLWMLWINQ